MLDLVNLNTIFRVFFLLNPSKFFFSFDFFLPLNFFFFNLIPLH